MRIKWNRHLDGRSSRQQDGPAPQQEAEEKKRGASSSPSIFKIFRRKKHRRQVEDENKNEGSNGNLPAPLHPEVDEDDSASISSIATCASQPVTEGFQRDRASSLFSSFRLSLPGSKRKKRKIAPTPSETVLNGQENEPQLERYSTPDLRKQSDKLEAPINNVQTNLSTSSPSICNPKGSSTSAQSLNAHNSESLDKLKWSSSIKTAASTSSKLSKSVSFSDCGDGLTDSSSHSTSDNKAPWAVNSTAMVEEEDSGALESELPSCMSDNPRVNREREFMANDDDSSSSAVNASSLQRKPNNKTASAAVMTKIETVSDRSFDTTKVNNISNIGNILNDIATEIKSYTETNDSDEIGNENSSFQENLIPSLVNCDSLSYRDGCVNETVAVDAADRNKVRVDPEKSLRLQFIETGPDISSAPEWNTHSKRYDNSYENPLLYPKNLADHHNLDKPNNTQVSLNRKLKVLSSELSVLTAVNHLSLLNPCDSVSNYANDVNSVVLNIKKDSRSSKYNSEMIKSEKSSVEKRVPITNSKHVLCHMMVYGNEPLPTVKDDKSIPFDQSISEVSSDVFNSDCDFKNETLTNNRQYETQPIEKSTMISASKIIPTCGSINGYSPTKRDSLVNESSALALCSENKISCDQKVPDNKPYTQHDHCLQNDQQVPEFERSLLEFEDVCNKYMSHSAPELSDCNSTIPVYSNSPKRKSVLDLNFSLIYPKFKENGGTEVYLRENKSPIHSDLIKQNMEINNHLHLQNSCQILTEKYLLPSPPKQWINYRKSIDKKSTRDACTDGVQCTKVRGKYLCQEPCLEALPTIVMPGDSDLGGIDTPQLSSTHQGSEDKSGREHSSIVIAEKQHMSDDRTSSEDMISNVSRTTSSSFNGVSDYSHVSETPGETPVYLDPEIPDTYRGPRGICDPLVYSTDLTKGFDSLGSENYLSGHNFCDMRSVTFFDVISEVSSDYVQAGNRLIEISNPYEDTFILPQDLSNQNLVNDVVSVSLPNDSVSDTIAKVGLISCDSIEMPINAIDGNLIPAASELKESTSEINHDESDSVKEMSTSADHSLDVAAEKQKKPMVNGERSKENKLIHIEQKNVINKNKNSMIPCRKKGPSEIENKRIETKLKSKNSKSLPRFNKSESQLPLKSNNSHRVFFKDSDAGYPRGKKKDHPVIKSNGNYSPVKSKVKHSESLELNLNSVNGSTTVCEDSACYVAKTSSVCSGSALELSDSTNGIITRENGISFVVHLNDSGIRRADSESVLSATSTENIIQEFQTQELDVNALDYAEKCGQVISEPAVSISENSDVKLAETFCSKCLYLGVEEHVSNPIYNVINQNCLKHSDITTESSRRSSLPAIGMRKTSFTSSKESLSSQLTSSSNRGKSRIPTKQAGPRAAPSSKGPVRPHMWLSKAELTQEIQRLGTLCEARTKELNRLKMETKHVSKGFDAFATLFKYMVEDLNGLSVPTLTEDLEKTLKQLELTKQDLAYYEREVEEMKSHHCQKLNDLSNKLFEVYQSEVAELNAKHQEEINHLKNDHQIQIEHLTATFDASSAEAKAHHEKLIASLEQEIINQREELQQLQEREIKDLEEKHVENSKVYQDHIEQLQKKCAELKQHSMSMEDAMRKDTDSKLQWVSTATLDLEKEVESLKAVLEMKNKELHTIRVQNLEMEKQLEDLPFAREKIKMLQARAEDLEALMIEKTKLERKLSTENQQMKDTYKKEAKINRRLSMENEELQWRLRQAENSLISGSFSEVSEFPEAEENSATSPTKSPGPQLLSRSVFFTFVDKDASTPHSPRSQYKKITPNFSANYKTSPAKSSKSPPAQSPRRLKSHSEPPQPPIIITSTPRKVAKQPLSKTKSSQKRPRSGIHSLEILREQRSTESSVDEGAAMGKKWSSDDIKITGELSNLETEDMSRSAEFSDPKTYYHMTFPVLKESGMADCDIDDACKNSSSGNSPSKEVTPNTMHSMSENNLNSTVVASDDTLRVMSMSSQEVATSISTKVARVKKRNSCTELTLSAGNVQTEAAANDDKPENRWRTI